MEITNKADAISFIYKFMDDNLHSVDPEIKAIAMEFIKEDMRNYNIHYLSEITEKFISKSKEVFTYEQRIERIKSMQDIQGKELKRLSQNNDSDNEIINDIDNAFKDGLSKLKK